MVEEAFDEQTALGTHGTTQCEMARGMAQYYQEEGANRRETVPVSKKMDGKHNQSDLGAQLIRRNEFVHGKDEATKREKLKAKL
jgi:hypothetical protein